MYLVDRMPTPTAIRAGYSLLQSSVTQAKLICQPDREIVLETGKLGDAKAPVDIAASLQNEVNLIYKKGFIATYQWIGKLSASLAFISSGVAFFMIKSREH